MDDVAPYHFADSTSVAGRMHLSKNIPYTQVLLEELVK
jgi:hypothetical protein